MFYKPEIRKKLRNERHHLESQSIESAANQVASQVILMSAFTDSVKLAFYLPTENELDPTPIINASAKLGKALFLPVTPSTKDDKILSFYSFNLNDPLIENRFGIQEPDTSTQKRINTRELDIIFLPLVGFDEHCNRLGRGAGYYDYTLSFVNDTPDDKRPILIGLGYEFQRITAITPSKWDIPLDYIVSETRTYQRTK